MKEAEYPLIDYASNLAHEMSLCAPDIETHVYWDDVRWSIFWTAHESLDD